MLWVLWDNEGRKIIHKVFDIIKKKSITQKLIADFILFYSAPQVAVEKFKNLNEYYKYTKKTNNPNYEIQRDSPGLVFRAFL